MNLAIAEKRLTDEKVRRMALDSAGAEKDVDVSPSLADVVDEAPRARRRTLPAWSTTPWPSYRSLQAIRHGCVTTIKIPGLC
jgi:hypothetical protein